jgi:hypothetical protein
MCLDIIRWSAALKAPLKSANIDVDILVVDFRVLQHHDDRGEGVVDVTLEAESVLLVAEYAVGFCVFRACIFD